MQNVLKGTFTALITPFDANNQVDYKNLEKLINFQIENKITGIVAVGTTGESPVLDWQEHNLIIEKIRNQTKHKALCIAGTGSNNTKEALEASKHAKDICADAVLLVEPYYNGPSSLEIRREYIAPIAKSFPELEIIPYIIPGRTGTQLLPEDLAILSSEFKNLRTVKEATGNLENMKKTRAFCGKDFSILSGDDSLTFEMIQNQDIQASGVISVMSNIVPKAVCDMVNFLLENKQEEAKKLKSVLDILFDLVTVKTLEETKFGSVTCRARNPLPIKTIMNILGMPSGFCRQPLGKMTKNGFNKVFTSICKVNAQMPELFEPIEKFFGVNIQERLDFTNSEKLFSNLYYANY